MTDEQVKNLKPEHFKRWCGVIETVTQIVEVVLAHTPSKQKTGKPNKLSLKDQLLMTLEQFLLVSPGK